MKSKTEETIKIYERVVDYFTNRTKGFLVEKPIKNRYISLRKKGSDLKFKLNIGDYDLIYLEIMKIDLNLQSGGTAFQDNIIGSIVYNPNGTCDNKRKVTLPLKRQQIELREMINHIQKSIRPNAINFIMDD